MSLLIERSISMWINVMLLSWLRSLPRVVSWECESCGLSFGALKTDGTSSCAFEISLSQQKSSPCKLYVDLTNAGKLLISCACSASAGRQSLIASGKSDGISSTRASSEAQPCGCDPGLRQTSSQRPLIRGFYACAIYPDCAYGRERNKRDAI